MSFQNVQGLRPSKDFFIEEYINKRRSALNIAKEIGVGETTIFRWLDSYGIKRRTSYENQHPLGFKEPTKEELYDLHHKQHKSLNEIARIYGVSWTTVKKWFKRFGLRVKSISEIRLPKDFVKPTKEELRKLYYDDNLSTNEIAKKLGVNISTIRLWLYEYKIPLKKTIPDKFPHNYWSKERIVNEIIRTHHENGDLSAKFCSIRRRKLFMAALEYFGSWKNAIGNAGLDYTKILKVKQWKNDEILNEIRELYGQEVDLSHKNIIKSNKKLIIASENNFGSWAKAIIAAGFDYYGKIAINKNKYWTKERICEKIKELHSKKFDLSSKNIRESEYGSLYDAAKVRFGFWENALKEAGINYREVSKLKAQTKGFKKELRGILTKEKLQELYVEKGYSTIEIGIMYDVSPTVIANLLKKHKIELKRPKYGYKKPLVCLDGHKVKSNLERNVCDWLYENGIEHECQPKYPKNNYYMRGFRGDFKVGKFIIEVLGMLAIPKYAEIFDKKSEQFMMVGGTGSGVIKGEDYDLNKPLLDKENRDVIVTVEPKNKTLSKEEINRQLGFLIPLFSKNQKIL